MLLFNRPPGSRLTLPAIDDPPKASRQLQDSLHTLSLDGIDVVIASKLGILHVSEFYQRLSTPWNVLASDGVVKKTLYATSVPLSMGLSATQWMVPSSYEPSDT